MEPSVENTPPAVVLDLTNSLPWGNISPGMRDSLVEAARVMLDAYHATIPAKGKWVTGDETRETRVEWVIATNAMKTTHGNSKDATEDGAYALAVLVADKLGFRVGGRMAQGSGADWFMTDPASPGVIIKLEVSGIAQAGSPGSRLEEKVQQGRGGTVTAPGLAVVFRFEDASAYSSRWA